MDMLKHFRDPHGKELKANSYRIELDPNCDGAKVKL
jgi:hypothetical protein